MKKTNIVQLDDENDLHDIDLKNYEIRYMDMKMKIKHGLDSSKVCHFKVL